jgi:glycosyltransferase involved in cell wall biosynthesis
MPVVSVLMPCYNSSLWMDEALESLVCQTLSDIEIICVEDGSTDDTPVHLEQWAARDRRLRVLRQPHAGVLAASNAGLQSCTAPYIARLDADDRAHPERLARQVAYLESHPEVGLVSCLVQGFPASQVRQGFAIYLDWLNGLTSDEAIRREIFIESPLPHPSVTYRRDLVLRLGGYQEYGWPEDYDLWMRMYLAGVRFAKLSKVLVEWREHPARLTRTDSRYSLENFLRLKAWYLSAGPLKERQAIIIWGAGMVGRRLGKQLLKLGAPVEAYIDIDPRKIGSTRRNRPVLAPEALPALWRRFDAPALLGAVGSRGARQLIRQHLTTLGLREGLDWWAVA